MLTACSEVGRAAAVATRIEIKWRRGSARRERVTFGEERRHRSGVDRVWAHLGTHDGYAVRPHTDDREIEVAVATGQRATFQQVRVAPEQGVDDAVAPLEVGAVGVALAGVARKRVYAMRDPDMASLDNMIYGIRKRVSVEGEA
jgi:hypothetical protein